MVSIDYQQEEKIITAVSLYFRKQRYAYFTLQIWVCGVYETSLYRYFHKKNYTVYISFGWLL